MGACPQGLKAALLSALLPALLGPAVFAQPDLQIDSLPVAEISPILVAAVGDVMLSSWVEPVMAEKGPLYPFLGTLPYLQHADVAIANLEAPFARSGTPFEKRFNFKVAPRYAVGLRQAGIDVVNLANNHILDFGEEALRTTLHTLDSLGVAHCGAGESLKAAHQPVVIERGGRKIALFGYSMTFPTEFYARDDSAGTAYPEPEMMQSALAAWDKKVDFIVVSFHWGAEKRETPKDYQIFFAHLAIDSGADLVLGHHPHVLQGLEIYRGRLIAYSLGNFAFGSYSQYAVDSIILRVYLHDGGLLFARCVPINVNNAEVEFQPQVLTGEAKRRVISKLQRLSSPLNPERAILADDGLILGDWAPIPEQQLLTAALSTFWNPTLAGEVGAALQKLRAGVDKYGSAH